MSIRIAKRAVLIFVCALVCAASGITALAAGNPSRAVSLSALSAAVKSGTSTQQAQNLCGITRLCGYISDTDSKDIILLGVVDPNLPALHLDDFVVALRNVRGTYNRVSGRVQYYADPGCSIDPNPIVLAQLRDFDATSTGSSTPEAMKARSETWKSIGHQPQKVRVMGVPFDSHFAKVMVDADYYMKRIVNGSVALGIDGLRSLSDLDIEARKQMMRSGKGSVVGGTMNRFWFSPGESTYEVRDGAILLRSCKVKLLTEEEFLTEQSVISGMGRPNPAADAFARSFSERYDQIAALRPIYKELNGLFAFVAVARLIKDERADKSAGEALGYLLKTYKIGCTPVSRLVNGLTDVREIDETVDAPGGPARLSMVQSSCGGVSMSVRPRRINTAVAPPKAAARTVVTTPTPVNRHSSGKVVKAPVVGSKSIKRAVLSSRKSRTALSWDVPVQLD